MAQSDSKLSRNIKNENLRFSSLIRCNKKCDGYSGIKTFLNSIKLKANILELDFYDMIELLRNNSTGDLASFLDSIKYDIDFYKDFERVENIILANFGGFNDAKKIFKTLQNIRQRQNESIYEFKARILDLNEIFIRSGYAFFQNQMIRYFSEGLSNHILREKVIGKTFTTLKEAVLFAVHNEKVMTEKFKIN